MHVDDPAHVRAQYRTEANLETRRSVWHPTADGRDPATQALATIVAVNPARVLEIGSGTGAFAARLVDALPDATVTTLDQSEHFVGLTRARGIKACIGDAVDLPYADDGFDVVAALWMLYHVPDVDRALADARRVLRPGGLFVAVTNGDGHLAQLRVAAGGTPMLTGFSTQNGEEQLRRHFSTVERTDLVTRAVFLDSDAALAYLRSSQEPVEWRLDEFHQPRTYDGETTIFCCS